MLFGKKYSFKERWSAVVDKKESRDTEKNDTQNEE